MRVALLALLALLAAPAPRAAADLTVPGWRVLYDGAQVVPADPGRYDSPVAIRPAEGGGVGLDQFIPAPDGPVTLRVDAGTQAGGLVSLEWFDARGREVDRRVIALPSDGSPLEAPGGMVTGARDLRVLVAGGQPGPLEVDRVELLDAAGRQLLANPELTLEGCPLAQHRDLPPFGHVDVPAWRPRYDATLVTARPGESRLALDPALRISNPDGFAGLDQAFAAPDGDFVVVVRGTPPRGRARIMVTWARQLAPFSGFVQIHEQELPLRLRGGVQSERFPRLGGGPDWRVVVAVVQLERGVPLDLDRVSAFSGGRHLLGNPELIPAACPPPPERPEPANALAPALRWPLTLLAAALAVLALLALRRFLLRHREEAPRPLDPRVERVVLVAVALLPLVDVGTLKAGVRLIAPDILFGLAGALLVLTHARRRRWPFDAPAALAVSAAALLAVVSAVSLALGLALYSDHNLAALSTGPLLVEVLGSPAGRGVTDLMRLLQSLAALYAVLCLVRTRDQWLRVARIAAITGIALCALAIYQVVGRALLGEALPLPPTTFRYPDLLRATGTFPEPNPFAGYMLFCAACAAVLIAVRPSRVAWAGLAAAVAGVLLTRSSAGFLGLGVLVVALLAGGRWRPAAATAGVVVAAALVAVAAGAADDVREVIDKPFQTNNSRLDRETTWSGGLSMGAAYAPLGVGRGQFAYNFAPFVAPEDVWRGGRAQSAAVEIWAEAGPVGLLLALVIAGIGPVLALRRLRERRAPPAVRASLAFYATLGAVMLTYYTSSYAWIWVAAALAVTAHHTWREPARDR